MEKAVNVTLKDFPADLWKRVKKLAKDNGMLVSRVSRNAFEAYLKANGK